MALPSSQVYEVRTTGSDTNGGGFDPAVASAGSDYSQQDAAQVTYTDLVIGGTNTQLTSAAFPFGSAHVGNTVRITSGTNFTVGSYSIRSVSGVIATMDRAVGTAGSIGGNGKLGGALASPGMAGGLVVSGNKVHIKNGTYTIAGGTVNTSGQKVNVTADSYWFGYASTRLDGGTPPRLQNGASSMTIFAVGGTGFESRVENLEAYRDPAGGTTAVIGFTTAGAASQMKRLIVRNMNGTSGLHVTGASVAVLECLSTGGANSTGAFSVSGVSGVTFEECIVTGQASGTAFTVSSAAGCRLVRCVADCGGTGAAPFTVSTNSEQASLESCVAYDSTTFGFSVNTWARLDRCVAHSTDGFNSGGTTTLSVNTLRACAVYNNSGSAVTGVFDHNDGFVTCSADPFTDAANGDFSLNSTSGGGADLKAIAQAMYALPTTTSYRDIGVAQSLPVAATTYYAS